MEEFYEDQQLPGFLQFLVLHELEMEVVGDQLQEDEAAISEHAPQFTTLLHIFFYGDKQSLQALLVGDAHQLTLQCTSLSQQMFENFSLFFRDAFVKTGDLKIFLLLLLLLFLLILFLCLVDFRVPQCQQFIPRAPSFFQICQCPFEDLGEERRKNSCVFSVGFWVVHDLKKECFNVLRLPREVIEQHFEDDDAQRPHIALVGIMILGKDLRGEVDWHAHQLLVSEYPQLLHDASVHHFAFGQAKICDLVKSILEEDVGRFQVAMDYVEFPQVLESLTHLPEHIQYLLLTS